jgi:sortase B
MEYLKKMAAYSLYDTDVTVTESDELLSLSTCEYSSKNGRLIVLARRVKGGE